METTQSKLTVLFEEPFWIGIFERSYAGQYEVCKVTFGAEPKENELYEFILRHFNSLRFSPPVKASRLTEKPRNPKRMQREVSRQLQTAGIGTKAQQALALQHEEGKLARKARTRQQHEEEQERLFRLRQEKKKEKHRGH